MNNELRKNETMLQWPHPTQEQFMRVGAMPSPYMDLPFPYQLPQNHLNQSLPYSVLQQPYPYLPPPYPLLPPQYSASPPQYSALPLPSGSNESKNPVPSAPQYSPDKPAPSQITKIRRPVPQHLPDQPAASQISKVKKPAPPPPQSSGVQHLESSKEPCRTKTTALEQYGAVPTIFTQANRSVSIIASSPTPKQLSAPPLHDVQDNYRHSAASCGSTKHQSSIENKKKIVVKLTPTVSHNPGSTAYEDAKILRKTMKNFMTNEKVIFDILGNRNNKRRLEIVKAYENRYERNLIGDLKSELSGKFLKSKLSNEFSNLIGALLKPSLEFYTDEIFSAIWSIDSKYRISDENILIEIFCTLGNKDIDNVCEIFKEKYNIELKSIIKEGTPGNSGKILLSLCAGKRDESNYVDVKAAEKDARILSKAEAQQFEALYSILEQRNIYQLKQIFQEYKSITSTDIYEHPQLKDIKKSLHSIVQFADNKAKFFAKRLYVSMSVLPHQYRDTIRIVVTRAEIDMGEIKQAFVDLYKKTLEESISEFLSDDQYKKGLIALIANANLE